MEGWRKFNLSVAIIPMLRERCHHLYAYKFGDSSIDSVRGVDGTMLGTAGRTD